MNKILNRKTTITQDEYHEVEARSVAANELLNDERFQFFRDMLSNQEKYAEDTVLNNTIREYQEVVPISDKIQRIFKTPKKVQVDELAGQYKLIKQQRADLEFYANEFAMLTEAIENKQVVVEGGSKDVTG